MASSKAKRNTMEVKEMILLNPIIEPYEIAEIVNHAWGHSFTRVKTDKNPLQNLGGIHIIET